MDGKKYAAPRIPKLPIQQVKNIGYKLQNGADLIKGGAKQLGKQLLNKGIEIAGNAIAPGLGKILADKRVQRAIITTAIIIFLILLFFIIFLLNLLFGGNGASQNGQSGNQQANPLTINKTCPPIQNTIQNSTTGTCTITLSFAYSVKDIIITDTLDKNAKFLDSTWSKYTTSQDTQGNTIITWKLSDNYTSPATNPGPGNLPSSGVIQGPINATFSFDFQPIGSVNVVYNLSTTAQTVGAVVGGEAGYIPPTTDNCNGAYAADFTKFAQYGFPQKNYGDPNCELTNSATRKDMIYSLILKTEQQQPNSNPTESKKYTDIWFVTIIPGESSFDPNSLGAPVGSQLTLDSGGAWGLFQMGSSSPPGQEPDVTNQNTWGKTDNDWTPQDHLVLDRGDVNWEMQINNAIIYNHKRLRCSFIYWGTFLRSGLTADPC